MSRRFWSEPVHQLKPYVPGEQPRRQQLIKLNTNESPYPPSPGVLQALQAIEGGDLMRYPDPTASELRETIADRFALDSEQVFVGNGSDEVLAHVFFALLNQPRDLLFPDICYGFYPVWAQLYGIRHREVPLREDFSIHADDYDPAAASVILPNPNAPTGLLLSLAELRVFLDASRDRLLVVDEAYVDFGGQSAATLLREYDNLLVVQTLSKSRALAGLRVGFALGSKELIEALLRVKDSFNSYPLDVVAQRAASAALRDEDWYREHNDRVIASREYLAAALARMDFEVLPSAANFLFVRHRRQPGRWLFDELRERGILVRRWDKARIDDYLRISIGTQEQVERVVAAFEEILACSVEAARV
ncbi:MAG: histidinol-phosphate transaminase [Halieaceae bacterium]|jgi:histidinol-phosphate aminotransferase|nr:histidinol-phosphate transaminase [Halieaceae bacterium]